MHDGVVNEIGNGIEAVITLTLLGNEAGSEDVSFVIDTGFSGALTLPIDIISRLNLPLADDDKTEITLADGSEKIVSVYVARLLRHGRQCEFEVFALGSELLVGMELLRGSNISIDAAPNGAVTISELSPSS